MLLDGFSPVSPRITVKYVTTELFVSQFVTCRTKDSGFTYWDETAIQLFQVVNGFLTYIDS